MRATNAPRGRLGCSTMITALLNINIYAMQHRLLANGTSPRVLPEASAVHVCPTDENSIHIKAHYQDWHSISYQVNASSSIKHCRVNITFPTVPALPQPGAPPQLLLVIIKPLKLHNRENTLNAEMFNPIRRAKPICITEDCGQTYLWASESVQLQLSLKKQQTELPAYEAAFIVAESTNVCIFVNGTGQLLMGNGSSLYAFAPDAGYEHLPPNNVSCNSTSDYSLTVRPLATSAHLNVTALACPTADSCATVLLNNVSCSVGKTVAVPQSGLMLSYERRSCNDNSKYSGFIVSTKDDAWAMVQWISHASTLMSSVNAASSRVTEYKTAHAVLSTLDPSTGLPAAASMGGMSAATISATKTRAAKNSSPPQPLSSSARPEAWGMVASSSTTDGRGGTGYVIDAAVASSREPDVSVDSGLEEPGATGPVTSTLVVATFAAFAVAASAIGITTALLNRRRRLLSRNSPSGDGSGARCPTRASDGGIAMVDNELYGETLKNMFEDRATI